MKGPTSRFKNATGVRRVEYLAVMCLALVAAGGAWMGARAAWNGVAGGPGDTLVQLGQQIPAAGTSEAPALAVFNNVLYMAREGPGRDQGIWTSSFDGSNWGPHQLVPGVGTSEAPALASFNNELYMVWKGQGSDQRIFWTSSPDGISWAPQQQIPGVATSEAPALAVFNGELYMVWKGQGSDQRIFWTSSPDGVSWTPQQQVP